MPWTTPTLSTLRSAARSYIMASLEGADALIPNSVIRVLADVNAMLTDLVMQFIAWLALQLLPITATTIWLDRWATMYLTNADGSKGRKQATFATGTGTATVNSPGGGSVAAGTILSGPNGVSYQTTEEVSTTGTGTITLPFNALTAGAIGNLDSGSRISFQSPPAGVLANVTIISLTGGTDTETDPQVQYRLLLRLANPPMGGDANDYVQWTLAVPGVTRAWAAPQEMGIGTMTIRFMCDTLRATNGGFPLQQDINAVIAYLDTVRPVTVKDIFVVSPIAYPISFTINNLNPDTPTAWDSIATSVTAMLFQEAAPAYALNGVMQEAQTIYVAWLSDAILNAPGIVSFDLAMDASADFVMPNNGSMATLGSVIHGPIQNG